jgi:hypothetical protein
MRLWRLRPLPLRLSLRRLKQRKIALVTMAAACKHRGCRRRGRWDLANMRRRLIAIKGDHVHLAKGDRS